MPFWSLNDARRLPGERCWYSLSEESQSMLENVGVSQPNLLRKQSCIIGLWYAREASVVILDVTLHLLSTRTACVESSNGVW